MQEFNGVYGKTYTQRDENISNLIHGVKVFGAGLVIAFGVVSYNATKEANKKFDVLKEDFRAASMVNNKKVMDDIVAKRKIIEKEYRCLPASWTSHKSYPVDFDDTICFKYSK